MSYQPSQFRSIDIVLAQVERERDTQIGHFEALDTEAGIVLGFAAALVALSRGASPWGNAARFLAVTAGFLSLATFWPRRIWRINVREFRDRYMTAHPLFCRVHLLDTQVIIATKTEQLLRRRSSALKVAMGALALSALAAAIGGY